MLEQKKQFLNFKHPPGRLTAQEAAWVLGMTVEEIRVVSSESIILRLRAESSSKDRAHLLTEQRRLKALGNPQPRSVKFFSEVDVSNLASDINWLHRAVFTIRTYWRVKKSSRRHSTVNEQRSTKVLQRSNRRTAADIRWSSRKQSGVHRRRLHG